jgi:hypothetical protein
MYTKRLTKHYNANWKDHFSSQKPYIVVEVDYGTIDPSIDIVAIISIADGKSVDITKVVEACFPKFIDEILDDTEWNELYYNEEKFYEI